MSPTRLVNAFQSMGVLVSSVGAKQGFLGMQATARAQVSFVSHSQASGLEAVSQGRAWGFEAQGKA